jgi:hypothetical protein
VVNFGFSFTALSQKAGRAQALPCPSKKSDKLQFVEFDQIKASTKFSPSSDKLKEALIKLAILPSLWEGLGEGRS